MIVQGISQFSIKGSDGELIEALVHAHHQALDQKQEALKNQAAEKRKLLELEHKVASQGLDYTPKKLASVSVGNRNISAGRFRLFPLHELAGMRAVKEEHGGLWFVVGTSPALDLGYLQANSMVSTTFQVFGQFNTLVSRPSQLVRPTSYSSISSSASRAALGCAGGLLSRHYFAPGPHGKFEQLSNGKQLNLLRDLEHPRVFRMANGFLLPANVHQPEELNRLLEKKFSRILVAGHEGLGVKNGSEYYGRSLE